MRQPKPPFDQLCVIKQFLTGKGVEFVRTTILDLSQAELAQRLGVSQQHISAVEKRPKSLLSEDLTRKIFHMLED